jgi:hypothetical protein
MSQPNNLRRCHTTLDQDSSLIAVVEMNQSSSLVRWHRPTVDALPPVDATRAFRVADDDSY